MDISSCCHDILNAECRDQGANSNLMAGELDPNRMDRSRGGIAHLHCSVVRTIRHDPKAFSQGIVLAGRTLYESTGGYGTSSLRQYDLDSGQVRVVRNLPAADFGEGLVLVDDQLIQLTWKSQVAFVYDLESLAVERTLSYAGQGWGICYDGEMLLMSDGGSVLQVRRPADFRTVAHLPVTCGGRPVHGLNDMVCVGDLIWANVFPYDTIVGIDRRTGRVTSVVDCRSLSEPGERPRNPDAVLNGVDRNTAAGTLMVTGKLWGRVLEVAVDAHV